MLSPYPIDPALSAIAVAYRNEDYVADSVLPRIRVDKQKFTFLSYADDTHFNIPDARVGRRSKPNEITLDATEVTDSTEDYALDGGVPRADMENADPRYDPLGNEVMFIAEMIALAREKRVADLVHAAATYPAGLKQTLAGANQFSDDTSHPIKVINAALDVMLMRGNQLVFSQVGWSTFRSHPEIVEACLGTGAARGNVTRQQVADLFEVKEIIVGTARANTAKRGQAAVLARLWGKHIALLYKAPVPQAKGAVTFGGTFEFGDRIASQREEPNMGMRGGIAVRAGESVKERVIANQAGYFIENAFA